MAQPACGASFVRQQGMCAEAFTPDMSSDSIEMLHFIDQWQVICGLQTISTKGVSDAIYDVVTTVFA